MPAQRIIKNNTGPTTFLNAQRGNKPPNNLELHIGAEGGERVPFPSYFRYYRKWHSRECFIEEQVSLWIPE